VKKSPIHTAVLPSHQRLAYGKAMMQEAERLLIDLGCPQINLQDRSSNAAVITFYGKLGCQMDEVVSMGKRLIAD
jgi:ribosomal protein S18 acetylase RimI-like enzyme